MLSTPDRAMAHIDAVQARGAALPPDDLPSDAILESWSRCVAAGLDGSKALQVEVVEAADLRQRRERVEFVRRLAQAELETLSQQIAGSNFLLAFADREGVILDLYTDNRFSMSDPGESIVAGSCWSEALCGTNGLGTALATGGAVAVTGSEHYFTSLGRISCTAAPIRDAHGDVVGVLDASSYFESRQRHTRALVEMAATQMENGLLVHQMRSHLVLAIHPRPEFLGTLSAGLLAFDGEGRLLSANARSRALLAGLDLTAGRAFESLLGEPFEQVTARLARNDDVSLRDVLGSSLVASCRSRPPLLSRAFVGQGAGRTVASAAPAPAPALAASPEGYFLATDPEVAQACRLVERAVRLAVPVLILGETGTGKEVLARHAHRASGRSGAFVAVNCGALPDELFEAELFGYAAGAFTGARREGSVGLIASADGGTLFLDELAELPMPLQAALLRFLDDRVVRPVGSTAARQVDVQLLAATHADLERAIEARRFRADLMYRLNTVRVELPPLRRRTDFAAAVRHVLGLVDARADVSADAIECLRRHSWAGNFRELRAVLTRALIVSDESSRLIVRTDIEALLPAADAGSASGLQQHADELVQREFERSGGSVSQTARTLGISRTTVYRHLRDARKTGTV